METNEWLSVLERAVAQTSQQQVAAELGVSKTSVSLVINGKYPASTSTIARLVTETYGNPTVRCPVLGEISLGRCALSQVAEFSSGSPQMVALWLACMNCEKRYKGKIIKKRI